MKLAFGKSKVVYTLILIATILWALVVPSPEVEAADAETSAFASESYQWKSVQINGGGYVPAVVYGTAENGLLYARTDVGGAYRWEPQSKTWIPLNDDIGRTDVNDTGILSVAPDPTDPDKVYLMTGLYYESWAGYGSLLASSDKGATWTRTPLPFKVGGNQLGRGNGERLQVDSNLPNVLWMGSNKDGLWKSTDSGASWNKVTSFPAAGTSFVFIDSSSSSSGTASQRIIVGATDESAGSLYRSNDGGSTWSSIGGQPEEYVPMRYAVNGDMMYITYSGFSNPGSLGGPYDATSGAVYKYNLSTGVWTDITPPGTGATHGFSGISLDKQNPDTLILSTLCRYTPTDEIFRTTDGGSSWTGILTTGIRDETRTAYPSLVTGMGPHWITSVEIDPFDSNKAIFVTGYGTYMTENLEDADSNDPVVWSFETVGMEETVPVEIKSPPVGPYLFSAMGDVTGFRHDNLDASPSSGPYSPQFSSNESIDYAELATNIVVRTSKYSAGGFVNGLISTDRGITWRNFETEPPGVTSGGKIAINADGTRILWSPVGKGVYVSSDSGATWTPSSGVTATGVRPVTDKVDPNKAYIYVPSNGKVYVSTNGGSSFVESSASVPALQSWLLDDGVLKSVFGQEGHLWLTGGSSGLYRSTDSGATFTKISNVTDAFRLGFGKSAPSKSYPSLFITGTIDGVYGFFRSDDEGATWVRVNDEQHQFGSIQDITGDPKVYGRLYVGTNGRGILYGDPAGYEDLNAVIAPMTAAYDPESPSDITVDMTLKGNALIEIVNGSTILAEGTDYSVSGTAVTINESYLDALAAGTTILTFNMDNGIDPVLDIVVKNTAIVPDTSTYNFEADLEGVTATHAELSQDTTKFYLGAASLKIEYASSAEESAPDVKLDAADLRPGDLVTYRIFIDRLEDANTLEFYGTHDGDQQTVLGTESTTLKNWWYTYTWLVPYDWNTIESFGFRIIGNGDEGAAWVDSIQLTRGSMITPLTAEFDKAEGNQTDIEVAMTLNGNSLVGVRNGSQSLTEGSDYTVSGTTVTLLKSYLAGQLSGTTAITFDFSSGNDPVLTINIYNSSSVPDTATYHFESSLQGWKVEHATGTQDMTKAYAGESSLKIQFSTITDVLVPNVSPAVSEMRPGDVVTYRVYIDGSSDVTALQFAGMHDGWQWVDFPEGHIQNPPKDQWISYTFTIPSDWVEIHTAGMYIRGNGGPGTVWVDSVDVTNGTTVEPEPDLATFNFEEGLQGWTVSEATGTKDGRQTYAGEYALKVEYSTNIDPGIPVISAPASELQPGDEITYHVYIDEAADATALQVDSLHDGWQWHQLGWVSDPVKGEWLALTYTIPSNWNEVQSLSLKVLGNGGSGTVWIDSVNVINGNNEPELAAIGNKTVREGKKLSFQITALDTDSDELTFTAIDLPAGASFNPDTRTFRWKPNHKQAGSYNVTFQVFDGTDIVSETIVITVQNGSTHNNQGHGNPSPHGEAGGHGGGRQQHH
ncbi:X2-like carbohydrate binding domain-containing protein [Paenibacillus sp. YIM B09110]|uniref:X2-like carbohydrate binding domain-containing protein n=1 Tax=Paenibacillus sp. YIM B09110 TaxID=3126102 RepID=UPI00301B9A1B